VAVVGPRWRLLIPSVYDDLMRLTTFGIDDPDVPMCVSPE
jgi:hypothetical protein